MAKNEVWLQWLDIIRHYSMIAKTLFFSTHTHTHKYINLYVHQYHALYVIWETLSFMGIVFGNVSTLVNMYCFSLLRSFSFFGWTTVYLTKPFCWVIQCFEITNKSKIDVFATRCLRASMIMLLGWICGTVISMAFIFWGCWYLPNCFPQWVISTLAQWIRVTIFFFFNFSHVS